MPTPMDNMPLTCADLLDNFAIFDNWEDRYGYLIDLGNKLPAMDPTLKSENNKVSGCLSQVWIVWHPDKKDPAHLRFIADSDAFIVKGIIAILMVLYDNKTADEILATDAEAVFRQIGLESHLSPSRRNGLSAMNGQIKSIAKAYTPNHNPA